MKTTLIVFAIVIVALLYKGYLNDNSDDNFPDFSF